jgi:hypothetical protein
VGGYAPRAREDSMRPRRWLSASGRPLNFTVRGRLRHSNASWLRRQLVPSWRAYWSRALLLTTYLNGICRPCSPQAFQPAL